MKLEYFEKLEKSILLRYKTTYIMSWSKILDFMQVFLNDIVPNVNYIGYMFIAGSKPTYIDTITEQLLYKTKELKEESGGIVLSGKSSSYKNNFEITAYNQTKIIDVIIPLTENIIKEIEEDNHLLDVYMNSLEINCYARDAQRYAINLFGEFLKSTDPDNITEKQKKFKELCVNLGATPFPK